MLVREVRSDRTAWSQASFAEALASLLSERHMSLQELARKADVEANYLESVLDGDREPPRGVIELVARALDLLPEHFLDYRLAAVIDALGHDPDRLNELFLDSLTELERHNVDVSGFDDRRFPDAVRALLAKEELTQGELAESIGLSQSELSRMLNGRRPLHTDLPPLIAHALGVNPEFFLAYRLALLGEWLRDVRTGSTPCSRASSVP